MYEKNVSEEVSDDEVDEGVAAVDYGSLDAEDDPLLAIVAEHVLSIIEAALERGVDQVHFDRFVDELDVVGIRTDEIDEAVAWLLQRRVITELEQDSFGLDL